MSLWVDLTALLQWHGNLTGIQRIQFNLSKLYVESGREVKFFVYHEQSRKFLAVDFKPEDIVQSGMRGKRVDETLPGYKRLLKKMGLLVFAGKVRRRLIAYLHKAKYSIHTKPRAPFEADDTVLVMGSIWIGRFVDDLQAMKDEKKFKLVHFAFDMIPSKFPGFVVPWLPKEFTNYHKKAFGMSEGILSISESTAQDVRDFMQLHRITKNPKIEVVRIGESIDDSRERAVKKIEPGFILAVSTIEARKNHQALYFALKEADRRGVKLPQIVIAGRPGWHTEDFLYMLKGDAAVKDRIVVINDVDDAKLTWLYRNCRFTVFPSFYEGWGMPVAESLAYGKLCIASDTSSIPEIAGNLIEYASPYDTGALLDVMEKYLVDDTLKKKEAQIKQQYKPTEWERMFDQVSTFVDVIAQQK